MTRYAARSMVSVEKSRAEIERLLSRYGASGFMSGWSSGKAHIGFEISSRRVKFVMKLPAQDESRFTVSKRGARNAEVAYAMWEQACRQSWRALALVIKAKLEAVEAGISVFEDEFMAHIVMPDGRTVGEHVRGSIAIAYESGKMPPMLPDYTARK